MIENLRTDRIARLRLGIQPTDRDISAGDLVEFVLGPFEEAERSAAQRQIVRAADACEHWLREGVSATMNVFNSTAPSENTLEKEEVGIS